MTPDYRRIHELEFELGFRDDPPPVVVTDAPGSVVFYSPAAGRPSYGNLGRTEVAWARQPLVPGRDLDEWIDADIERRAKERESRSVRG